MEPHVTTFDCEGDGLVNADDPNSAFCKLMGGSIQSVELDLMENVGTLARIADELLIQLLEILEIKEVQMEMESH